MNNSIVPSSSDRCPLNAMDESSYVSAHGSHRTDRRRLRLVEIRARLGVLDIPIVLALSVSDAEVRSLRNSRGLKWKLKADP